MKPPRLDLNPSSADRWTTCTASPRFIMEHWDKVPPSETAYNQEGAAAHEVAASFLQDRPEGETPVTVSPEMRTHAWDYMEYVQGLREKNSHLIVEKKYPLWYMPERNAMIDAAVINPRSLHIVDYKYGEGIPVSPIENLQGAIYARSVIRGFNDGDGLSPDFPVTIHIYQPRGRNAEDGAAHKWETTWGELRVFTDERVTKAARSVLWNSDEDLVKEVPSELQFAPSDKACQWCPAKGFCTARMKHLTGDFENLAIIEHEPPAFPAAAVLSDEQRAAVQKHGAEIKKWIEGVMDYNTERAVAGHALPGYKLVLSRGGNRAWSDPRKAAELLVRDTILKREEVIEEKTIGPATVEKFLGKNKMTADLMNLIVKPPGSPCLAPVEDKRPALTNAASDFTNLENVSEPAE